MKKIVRNINEQNALLERYVKKLKDRELNKSKQPQLRLRKLDLKRKLVLPSKLPKPKDKLRFAKSKSGKSANTDKTSAKKRSSKEAPATLVRPVILILLMMRNVKNGSVESALASEDMIISR